jgi:hypothetical protein
MTSVNIGIDHDDGCGLVGVSILKCILRQSNINALVVHFLQLGGPIVLKFLLQKMQLIK